MKKLFCLSMLTVATVIATGCASPSSRLGYAAFGDRIEPLTATSATGASKTGTACSSNILGLYAGGDASIDAAKKAGGITTLSSADVETSNILNFYASVCTIVHGN